MKRYKLYLFLFISFTLGAGLGLWLQIIYRFTILKRLEMALWLEYLILRSL